MAGDDIEKGSTAPSKARSGSEATAAESNSAASTGSSSAANGSSAEKPKDLVKDTLREMDARVKELAPMVQEYERLIAAIEALRGTSSSPAPKDLMARTSGSTGRSQGRRGRPRGRGAGGPTRAQQLLSAVQEQPGITVTEAAKKIGMGEPTGLYQVAKQLTENGQLRKDGSGYHPARASAASASEGAEAPQQQD